MPDDFAVDTRGLDAFARKMRLAAVACQVEVDKTLVKVGAEHLELSKQIAGEHSTSIAPTIKMRAAPGAVSLTAAGPLAVLYEKGNKKRNGSGRVSRDAKRKDASGQLVFRHPTYGNQNAWVDQPRYPFFSVARRRLRKRTNAALAASWRSALRKSGLRG